MRAFSHVKSLTTYPLSVCLCDLIRRPSDVWILNTATGSWSLQDPYPVPSNADLNLFGSGVEHAGTLMMIGGWSVVQRGITGRILTRPADHSLQFDGSTFLRRPIAPLHPITFPALVSFRGSLLVQGGEDFEGLFWNEVFVSNADYAVVRPTKPVSSTAAAQAGESSTGGGVVPSTSTGAASTGDIAASTSSTGPADASTSIGASGLVGDIGVDPDGSLHSAVDADSDAGRFGSLPKWALVLCVVLGALLVACLFCIVLLVRRRRKHNQYEMEERAQIDATLAAQAERERIVDLEAQRQKKALAAVGGPGARGLAATPEEKARAEKELRKLTFGVAAGGAVAGGALVGNSHKNGSYDPLSEKDSQGASRSGSEPRNSIVGPPSVTGLSAYPGHHPHDRSSLSLASSSSHSNASASSTPTVSRRNSFAGVSGGAPGGVATPGSSSSGPSVGARPTLASFLSPQDGGFTPVTANTTPSAPPPPMHFAAATAAVGGATGAAAAGAGGHKSASVSPPMHHRPPPPPPQQQQPQWQPTPPPRLAPLSIPHASPIASIPAPVPVPLHSSAASSASMLPAGPPPPPPTGPPPSSAVGPSASMAQQPPAPSAPSLDADADATHALELPLVMEYNYTFDTVNPNA